MKVTALKKKKNRKTILIFENKKKFGFQKKKKKFYPFSKTKMTVIKQKPQNDRIVLVVELYPQILCFVNFLNEKFDIYQKKKNWSKIAKFVILTQKKNSLNCTVIFLKKNKNRRTKKKWQTKRPH